MYPRAGLELWRIDKSLTSARNRTLDCPDRRVTTIVYDIAVHALIVVTKQAVRHCVCVTSGTSMDQQGARPSNIKRRHSLQSCSSHQQHDLIVT